MRWRACSDSARRRRRRVADRTRAAAAARADRRRRAGRGERVAELALVERLGVSRTPVRAALLRLQEEGLLEALPGGGFAVRGFSEADIHDAIEVRGTLEGLAARLAAERGVAPSLLAEARECLAAIDALLADARRSSDGGVRRLRGAEPARFHALLAEMAGSALVRRQIERAVTLPFASPNGFVMVQTTGPHARDTLVVAQEQHHAVIEAIVRARRRARRGADARARAHRAAQPARGAAQPPGAAAGAGRAPDPPRGR